MDPQHRLFMQVAWAAFETAGYAPRTGTPRRTGVFASSGIDGYLIHHLDGKPLKNPLRPHDIFLAEVERAALRARPISCHRPPVGCRLAPRKTTSQHACRTRST
jgi:hypothetical protein